MLTGPVRDLDVYLMNFAGDQKALPQHMRDDLLPLHTFLTYKREEANQMLVQQLRASRYPQFKQDWRKFLDGGLPENSDMLVLELANRRITRLYPRVLHEGGTIRTSSPPEALHESRKSARNCDT